jgi:hypothetical protein
MHSSPTELKYFASPKSITLIKGFLVQVSMANAPVVKVLYCTYYLFHDFSSDLLFEAAIVNNMLEKVSSIAHGSNKVKVVIIHVYFMEVYDVWMIDN